MNITAYKTNLGLFISCSYGQSWVSSFNSAVGSLDRWKVNGVLLRELAVPTHHPNWVLLPVQEITSVEDKVYSRQQVVGYTLKMPELANEKIPLYLTRADAGPHYDEDYEDTVWKNYNEYRPLYKEVVETTAEGWTPVEFSVKILRELKIDNLESPVEMKVSILRAGTWGGTEKEELDLSSIVCYSDIEKMLTPEFLLHERPCQLTSKQAYEIVRSHIKDNINPAYARVTSDYNFCFTVSRKMAIKPYNVQVDKRKTSRSKPKFVTQAVTHKEVAIFEMTFSPENYKGYTPIAGWQANNLKEMKEQIESYLTELMDEINRPVQECQACSGTGCTDVAPIGTNDR